MYSTPLLTRPSITCARVVRRVVTKADGAYSLGGVIIWDVQVRVLARSTKALADTSLGDALRMSLCLCMFSEVGSVDRLIVVPAEAVAALLSDSIGVPDLTHVIPMGLRGEFPLVLVITTC